MFYSSLKDSISAKTCSLILTFTHVVIKSPYLKTAVIITVTMKVLLPNPIVRTDLKNKEFCFFIWQKKQKTLEFMTCVNRDLQQLSFPLPDTVSNWKKNSLMLKLKWLMENNQYIHLLSVLNSKKGVIPFFALR